MPEENPLYGRRPTSLVAAKDDLIEKRPHGSSCSGKQARKETSIASLVVAGNELIKNGPTSLVVAGDSLVKKLPHKLSCS